MRDTLPPLTVSDAGEHRAINGIVLSNVQILPACRSPKYCVLKGIQHTPVDFRWFECIYFTLPAREDPIWASQFKGNHLALDLRARFKHAAVG